MAVFTAKVPVAIATGIVGFLLGGGLIGVVLSYAAKPEQQAAASGGGDETNGGGSKAGPPGGMPGGMPGGGGGKGGKGGGGGGGGKGGKGGGGGAVSKMQLASLVGKLDTLTKKPLAVELTADQKKQVKELLAGLEGMEELKEEDAKAKLEALLKLVEGNRETLEAAGFRWPGGGGGGGGGGFGGGGGMPPSNPFKEGDGAARLKSLQSTLEK